MRNYAQTLGWGSKMSDVKVDAKLDAAPKGGSLNGGLSQVADTWSQRASDRLSTVRKLAFGSGSKLLELDDGERHTLHPPQRRPKLIVSLLLLAASGTVAYIAVHAVLTL